MGEIKFDAIWQSIRIASPRYHRCGRRGRRSGAGWYHCATWLRRFRWRYCAVATLAAGSQCQTQTQRGNYSLHSILQRTQISDTTQEVRLRIIRRVCHAKMGKQKRKAKSDQPAPFVRAVSSRDRQSTRLYSSHSCATRMPSSPRKKKTNKI